jgi:serine beta-lactamase-like protein LACTB
MSTAWTAPAIDSCRLATGRNRLKAAGMLLPLLAMLALPAMGANEEDAKAALAQRLLEALHESSGVPGLGAAVWQDGRLRWQGQAGWHDVQQRRPLGPDTRFRLASVSKLFTATAAALLHQEGRLNSEAPLPTPWYPSAHAGAAITPRQLASHLAGLPHYEWADAGRGQQAFADSRSAAQHWLSGRTLRDAPGRSYHYSSWGYTLLGAAVEQASGASLADFITQRLTSGLAIGPERTDTDLHGHSRPYEAGVSGWRVAGAHDYSYSLGGAGLSATPGALAEWGGRVLQGAVLEAGTLAWMTRPSRLADGRVARHGPDDVAFGWRLGSDTQGRPHWHHSGNAVGARGTLVVWPDAPSTAVALLSNASWVSSIDESARTLAAPWMEGRRVGVALPCPKPGQRFQATWGDQSLSGTVEASPGSPSPCERRLVLDRPSSGFDNQGPPRATPALRLISMEGRSGLGHAALATPIGLFQLESAADGRLVGQVAGRKWAVVF